MFFQFGEYICSGVEAPGTDDEEIVSNFIEHDLGNGGKKYVKNGDYDSGTHDVTFQLVYREDMKTPIQRIKEFEELRKAGIADVLLDNEGNNLGYYVINSIKISDKVYNGNVLISAVLNLNLLKTEK